MTSTESTDAAPAESSFVEACWRIEVLFVGLQFFNTPSAKMRPADVLKVFATQAWQERVAAMITEATLRRLGELISDADHSPQCDVKPLRRVVRKLRGLKQVLRGCDLSVFLGFLEAIRSDIASITDERLQTLERIGYDTIEISNYESQGAASAVPTTVLPSGAAVKVSDETPTESKLMKVEKISIIERHVAAAMLQRDSTDVNILGPIVNEALKPQGLRVSKKQVIAAKCRQGRVKQRRPKGSKAYSFNELRDAKLNELANDRTEDRA